jgi:spore germination cell wall hydrolase CwlJ-like protein
MKYLILGACALAFLGGLITGKSAFASDDDEVRCLAKNVYFESRNQSLRGMIAVALVTMNRVNDSRFPNTVCEVVYQGPMRESWKTKGTFYPIRNKCQFSWYCDGKADIVSPHDEDLYGLILAMSFKIYHDDFDDFIKGATHYHAYYVQPEWASTKTMTYKVGDHIFYRWEK